MLGLHMLEPGEASAQAPPGQPGFDAKAFIKIAADGTVTLVSRNPEIGQGIQEDAAHADCRRAGRRLESVKVEQADFDAEIRASIHWRKPCRFEQLDPYAASGRGGAQMMIAAAAKKWGVPASECYAHMGRFMTDRQTGPLLMDSLPLLLPLCLFRT